MQSLSEGIIRFLHKESFVIVSTVGKDGTPHTACKGVVDVDQNGKVYLLDLYKKNTYKNLKLNNHIAITAVNEHKFEGYNIQTMLASASDIKTAILQYYYN